MRVIWFADPDRPLSRFYFLSDYTVVVKTSNDNWAGTDATVKIRIRGSTGVEIERALPGDSRYFERGRYVIISFVIVQCNYYIFLARGQPTTTLKQNTKTVVSCVPRSFKGIFASANKVCSVRMLKLKVSVSESSRNQHHFSEFTSC